MQDHSVLPLNLFVGPRVTDRGPVYPDVVVVTEVEELLAGEV
jgi:hypothetical protein